jgi:endonuclease YncB( thermonuclease family)
MTSIRFALTLVGAALAATSFSALAHEGGLDEHGCHTNHKTGVYHCHHAAVEEAAPHRTFEGTASVIDGDSLRVKRREVRLFGIDAVEHEQMCRRDNEKWACGLEATLALRELAGGKTVQCQDYGRDQYGRTLAVCSVGKVEINDWLVRQGWAMAYRRYSNKYVESEKAAREARRNIWSGKVEMPETYRHRQR